MFAVSCIQRSSLVKDEVQLWFFVRKSPSWTEPEVVVLNYHWFVGCNWMFPVSLESESEERKWNSWTFDATVLQFGFFSCTLAGFWKWHLTSCYPVQLFMYIIGLKTISISKTDALSDRVHCCWFSLRRWQTTQQTKYTKHTKRKTSHVPTGTQRRNSLPVRWLFPSFPHAAAWRRCDKKHFLRSQWLLIAACPH